MDALRQAIARWWGYNRFRLLQCEAIYAVFTGRDSVVVLPTFGVKSLAFQSPARVRPGLGLPVIRSTVRQL
jgi:ATP-dependent DNA helicase RecQ